MSVVRCNLLRVRESHLGPSDVVMTNPAVMERPHKGECIYLLSGAEGEDPRKYVVVEVIHNLVGHMTPGYVQYDCGTRAVFDVLLRAT